VTGLVVFAAVVLLLSAAFNAFAWPTFFKRVTRDPRARDGAGRRTPFFTVHLALLVVALALALAALVAAILLLAFTLA